MWNDADVCGDIIRLGFFVSVWSDMRKTLWEVIRDDVFYYYDVLWV